MSLNVGELMIGLGLDTAKFDTKSKQIEGDAKSTGKRAGDALSDGLDSGSKLDASSIYSSRGDFESAASKVGQGAGAGLSDGAESGASGLGDSLSGVMSSAGPPMVAAATAVAALAGAALIKGINQSFDQESATDKLQAQLGASDEMAADYGKTSGDLYAKGFGESYSDITAAQKEVFQNGILGEDATQAEIEAITGKLMTVSDVLGQDVGMTSQAVGSMLRNGLAKDANEAFDILTRGVQQGVDKSGDLMETFQEYGPLFSRLGLDGAAATGMLGQGLKAGARDADFVADALKEFQIRSTDASATSKAAYEAIGLNASEMTAKIAKGGPEAKAGLDQVLDGLRAMEDPVARNNAAVGLFGTKAEDLGDALFALDPDSAADSLGNLAGATDKLAVAYDNPQSKIESFKRQGLQKLTDFIGGSVIPAIEKFAQSKGFQEWLANLQAGAAAVAEWFERNWPLISEVISTMVDHAVTALGFLWDYTKIGIDVFMWLWHNVLSPLASWIGETLVPIIVTVASWLGDKLGANVTALASYFTDTLWPALQSVASFITGTVVPTISTIISKFIEVASTVGAKIAELVGFVTSIPGRISSTVSTMWNGIKDGITSARDWVWGRVEDIVGFWTGLGGRIGGAISGLADTIKSPFTSAFNAIKSAWNNTAGSFSFTIPDFVPGIGGKGWSFPKMHTGGMVRSGPGEGSEVLRLLKVGEMVLTAGQQAQIQMAMSQSGATGGGMAGGVGWSGNVNVQTNADPHQIAAAIAWRQKTAGV